jgi:hypothetical protein
MMNYTRAKVNPLRMEICLMFLLVLAIGLPSMSYAFTSRLSPASSVINRLSGDRQSQIDRTLKPPYTQSCLSAEASPVGTSFGSEADDEDAKKDNPFTVGAVVRVAAEGIKAYQVKPQGFGKFDENKNFVPATKGGPRGTKNLLIPVGMRGVVTKAYNVDDISANFPIQVKFTPGENVDEGYDPPVPLLMHLLPEELELV